jgi:hypothetical protein
MCAQALAGCPPFRATHNAIMLAEHGILFLGLVLFDLRFRLARIIGRTAHCAQITGQLQIREPANTLLHYRDYASVHRLKAIGRPLARRKVKPA